MVFYVFYASLNNSDPISKDFTFLQWYEKFTGVDEVIPVSAKFGQGVEDIKEWILSKLPMGPAYYPKVH